MGVRSGMHDLVALCTYRLQSQRDTARRAAASKARLPLLMVQPSQQSAPEPATQRIQMPREATNAFLPSLTFSTASAESLVLAATLPAYKSNHARQHPPEVLKRCPSLTQQIRTGMMLQVGQVQQTRKAHMHLHAQIQKVQQAVMHQDLMSQSSSHLSMMEVLRAGESVNRHWTACGASWQTQPLVV